MRRLSGGPRSGLLVVKVEIPEAYHDESVIHPYNMIDLR